MSVFFGVSMFAIGILIPYFPLLLNDRGLDAAAIGYLLATPYLLRLVTLPALGALADRVADRRAVLAGIGVATVGFALLFEVSTATLVLFAATAGLYVAAQSFGPMSDVIALSLDRSGLGSYGRMRLWGSVTFVVGNMAGGALLASGGLDAVYAALVAAFAATLAAVAILPKPPVRLRAAVATAASPVLRNPAFLGMLLAGGLLQASHAALYGFGTLAWSSRGYSEVAIGNLWAIGVIAEILLFAAAPQLFRRFSAWSLLVLAAAVGTVRWAIFPLDLGLGFVAATQVLHAGSFACGHLGVLRFISDVVPDERAGAAQGSYMVMLGLAMCASTALAGPLFASFGIGSFAFMAIFCALSLALLVAGRIRFEGLGPSRA